MKNNNYKPRSACYIPGTVQSFLHILFHLFLMRTLGGRYLYFINEETGVSGKIIFFRAARPLGVEAEFEGELPDIYAFAP